MITNPQTALISVAPPENVEFFRLTYLGDGQTAATLVQTANPVGGTDFSQNLAPLNALVPAQFQHSDLTLTARAGNSAGESGQIVSEEVIRVVNPPTTPTQILVS